MGAKTAGTVSFSFGSGRVIILHPEAEMLRFLGFASGSTFCSVIHGDFALFLAGCVAGLANCPARMEAFVQLSALIHLSRLDDMLRSEAEGELYWRNCSIPRVAVDILSPKFYFSNLNVFSSGIPPFASQKPWPSPSAAVMTCPWSPNRGQSDRAVRTRVQSDDIHRRTDWKEMMDFLKEIKLSLGSLDLSLKSLASQEENRKKTEKEMKNMTDMIKELKEHQEKVASKETDKLKKVASKETDKIKKIVEDSRKALVDHMEDIKNTLVDHLSNPTGLFVEALRSAVKKPARKKRPNSQLFPEDQEATPEQLHSQCCLIFTKLSEMLKELQQQPDPGAEILKPTYRVWKHIRNDLGSVLKKLRLADPNCQQKLLWTNVSPSKGETAGQRYVYTKEELTRYLDEALKEKVMVKVTTDDYLATKYVLMKGKTKKGGKGEEMTRGEKILRLLREEKTLDLPKEDFPASDVNRGIPLDDAL
eukprot:s5580_g2.t1